MIKVYKWIENPQIYKIYNAEEDILIETTNEAGQGGVIVFLEPRRRNHETIKHYRK